MKTTRRTWFASAAAAAAAVPPTLPLKNRAAEFPVVHAETCLNNARWHPVSAGAMQAVRVYLDYKAAGGGASPEYGARIQQEAKSLFAALINARPSEISFIPSTMAGENAIVSALGLPGIGGNVVTDALHFEGSLYLYGEFAKRNSPSFQLRTIRPRSDWTISLDDLDRSIDRNTRLVAISLVSMMNGFQHDLKAVCDIAHAKGAYVYADIVQAAGAVPIDVRATGVDFCACASYKWLMGDMGLGFLYVREGRLDRVLHRTQYGYRQLTRMDYHLFPHDPPGDAVFEWEQRKDAAGYFELGTISNTTAACLTYSLKLIRTLGVETIQEYRQPLLRRLQKELPALGYQPLTPPASKSPIVAFAVKDSTQIAQRLKAANVDIAVYPPHPHLTLHLHEMKDVDRLTV